MERTSRDVDEFLSGLEGMQGEDIRRLDAAIIERMPGHDRHLYEGKLWGGTHQQIVGYGLMDYTNRSGDDVGGSSWDWPPRRTTSPCMSMP